MMKKETVVFGLINTISGEHLVVQRIKENNYGFPGGKVKENELPKDALIREVFEETGLRFSLDDFEIINVQQNLENEVEQTVHVFGCKKLISDVSPIFTTEKHIKPVFMEPSMFFTLTKFKDFYLKLFPLN
jgi:8-oxo-dGTP pyrophosphatase MutT (NUDIX family)